jgi:hypothetical protein
MSVKNIGNTRHGMSHTRLWRIWEGMIRRCKYPSDSSYPRYGARGITVCEKWKKFERFRDFAWANGYNDSLTIDRIDPDGNYEPSNVRFITRAENNACRRILNKKIVVNNLGEHFGSITAAARAYGRSQCNITACVRGRVKTSAGLIWSYA